MPYMNPGPLPVNYGAYGGPAQPYQNGIFYHVKSIKEAQDFQLGLGQSAIFINDNEPEIYTKTMGMSPLDPFTFKIFDISERAQNTQPTPQQTAPTGYLTKDDLEPIKEQLSNMSGYLTKDDFEPFKNSLNDVCRKLDKLKELTE